jgi:2-dehydro-3-deoxy-D-gluconate 5-dehydrogenase
LVNNAGTTRRMPILEFTESAWDEVLNTDLKVPFFLSQACVKQMLKQGSGGKIVNICSVLSFQGGWMIPAYVASKHGLAGVTKAMANELAPHGINVNGIAPGYIETEITRPLQNDEVRNRQILERVPQGRWGRPDDLVGATVFLSSAAADFMHGHILAVDGGWLSR